MNNILLSPNHTVLSKLQETTEPGQQRRTLVCDYVQLDDTQTRQRGKKDMNGERGTVVMLGRKKGEHCTSLAHCMHASMDGWMDGWMDG
jgi:hypothetical protein